MFIVAIIGNSRVVVDSSTLTVLKSTALAPGVPTPAQVGILVLLSPIHTPNGRPMTIMLRV